MPVQFQLPPKPRAWEVREVTIRLALVPFALLPARARALAARAVAAILFRPGSGFRKAWPEAIPPGISALSGLAPLEIARRAEMLRRREMMLSLRAVVLPRWRRPVAVAGMEYVREALAAGGAILWVSQCVSHDIAVKQALLEGGFPLTQLSRPSHPFSNAPFGRRFVNPILRRPEDRFLAERVFIDADRTVTALRRLRVTLKTRHPVGITVTVDATTVEAYDFLGGTLRLAAGPVDLAASTGSALLPVFVSGPPEHPCARIGPPLPITGRNANAIREAHLGYIRWLEARIADDPLAWTGWRSRTWTRRRDSGSAPTEPAPPAPPAASESP